MDLKGRAWIEVSKQAISENYLNLLKYLPSNDKCFCVVKADGYGMSAIDEAKVLQLCGANKFAVACADEGRLLRENGIEGDILILSHTLPEQFDWLKQYDLIATVGDLDYGDQLNQYASQNKIILRVHLKIDTGMHRLGIRVENNLQRIQAFCLLPNIKVEGCFTHFSCADSFQQADVDFTINQEKKFAQFVKTAHKMGINLGKLHTSASAAIVNYPQFNQYDYVRAGILLLGFTSGEMKDSYPRKQAMSIYSRISKIDDLLTGEFIGYGRTYQANKKIRVATIPIGYGDGIPRNYHHGEVLINGSRCPIIGRISMDQLCVDVTNVKCQLFDLVTLIGKNGNDEILIEELASKSSTISNEVLTRLSKRLPRIYY